MGKRPSLCAIAIDREGLMLQCLLHKTRDDHAVAPRLAWPYSIEKPYDDYWQLLGPVVGQSGELVDQLGSRITPARFGRRAVDAVVRLLEWSMALHTINLRRGGDQYFFLELAAELKDDLSTMNVGHNGRQRILQDILDTHCGGQVDHNITRA